MDQKLIRRIGKSVLTAQLASRHTDPAFYSSLTTLPNPDPILRDLGYADRVYDAILSDAHVIGEVRSIRSSILSYRPRATYADDIKVGDKEQAAKDLISNWLRSRPSRVVTWQDTIWNMFCAVFCGYRAHEKAWFVADGHLLPQLIDIPNRRVRFDTDNNPRLLTRDNPVDGDILAPEKVVLTRHMPEHDNPYGRAVLSSCYWPYTFKHGGFKFFYEFCERFGLPWPVGKYPAGTPPQEQQQLMDALIAMVQGGAGVIPDGDSVELHQASASGDMVQEALIRLCNAEMSKALTSQTLATEMHKVGSNAASKTSHERQQGVQESDRSIVEEALSEVAADIVRYNFGPDVIPPRIQLYKPKSVTKERADIWEVAARIGRPSLAKFHEEMNIPIAADDSDVLRASGGELAPPSTNFAAHACAHCGQMHSFSQAEDDLLTGATQVANQVIANNWIQPAADMLKQYEAQGKTLIDFQADLPKLFGSIDDDTIVDITTQALAAAAAQGTTEE